ncbi:MAG: hypothetical protein HY040_16765 [Planctomycetes bacterium]|nr:hypothetical protein [Planctomycetota bacterium]
MAKNTVITLLLLFSITNHADAQVITAQKVLDLNIDAHKYCSDITMDVEGVLDQKAGPSSEQRIRFSFWRKGNSLSAKGTLIFVGSPEKDVQNFHDVTNEKGSLGAAYNEKTKAPEFAYISSKSNGRKDLLFDQAEFGCALDGYFPGTQGRTIAELMRKAPDLRLEETTVDGEACFLVTGSIKWGKVSLWVSKKSGFLLKKATLEQGLHDVYGFDDQTMEDNNKQFHQQMKTCTIGVRNLAFENHNGVPLPIQGEYTIEWENASATPPSGKAIYRFKRTNVVLRPDLQAKDPFTLDLPDGFRVFNEDERDSGVSYQWKGGQVVPAFADFDQTAEGFWTGSRALALVSLAIVGAVLLVISLRFWCKRKPA